MSIIKVNIPGFDNDLAVKAEVCHEGKMYKVSAAQVSILLPEYDKHDLPVYFHKCEVTEVKPILFRFTLSAKSIIPGINTNHIVRAIREDDGLLGPVYVVSITELLAAGVPRYLFGKMTQGAGCARIMVRNTLPVRV